MNLAGTFDLFHCLLLLWVYSRGEPCILVLGFSPAADDLELCSGGGLVKMQFDHRKE